MELPIDPEKARAALEQLEAEQARRLQAKLTTGDAVLVQVCHVVADEIEAAGICESAPALRADGVLEVYDTVVIITGVPDGGDYGNYDAPSIPTLTAEKNPLPIANPYAPADDYPMACDQPETYVRVILSNGDRR
jgi:hypothetical protein